MPVTNLRYPAAACSAYPAIVGTLLIPAGRVSEANRPVSTPLHAFAARVCRRHSGVEMDGLSIVASELTNRHAQDADALAEKAGRNGDVAMQ